jgi:hypothetical protein
MGIFLWGETMAQLFTEYRFGITDEKLRYEYGRLLNIIELNGILDSEDYGNDIAILQVFMDKELSKPEYEISMKDVVNLISKKAELKESLQRVLSNRLRDRLAEEKCNAIPMEAFKTIMNRMITLVDKYVDKSVLEDFHNDIETLFSELINNENNPVSAESSQVRHSS